MNVLEICTIESPYGKSDECAKLSIYDVAEWFVLSDIMSTGTVYTFNAWIRSDDIGNVTIGESYFTTATGWTRCKATFMADDANLKLIFSTPGTYYVYHPQLEIGTVATDWTPAPEDQSEEMEVRFSVEADKIEAQFEVVNNNITNLDETIKQKYIKTITENENGISITDSDGVYEIQVDNVDGVTIRKNGEVRSQLVDDDFYTGNVHIRVEERAQFGNFAFVPRSDGSLSFLKVGG